ncbi:hypothetical protein BC349_19315 [Flavihumibacter stibioxidans]|uniref:YD repeat-containing protein n=1 Tax=Flavihumibacter stibioxidans TaxID=1834163 RepID=A0ABR7MEL1_9BACT|nr:hypothetical protein [Flavihumibacter stibioxidans]
MCWFINRKFAIYLGKFAYSIDSCHGVPPVRKFWYDRLGRLAISQNAQQLTQGNVYSYTLYDSLGRITQVGQLTGGSVMTDPTAKSTTSLQNWLNAAANSRNQITQTVYDQAYPAITDSLNQSNLRNRVSYTQVINQALDTYPATATYYSYDVQGNVDWKFHGS